MSSGSLKNVTKNVFTNPICLIYMSKQDLELTSNGWYAMKPNQSILNWRIF